MELISRPPRTIMEVYKMLPEGTLAELIDGTLYMSPSPLAPHQRIVTQLSARMSMFVDDNHLGDVYVAPMDVYLDQSSNAVQPDIIYISVKNLSIIKDYIHGVPDLIIEVLSKGNKTHDTVTKKNLYEKFGVGEYWIIDPETKQSTGYQLEDGQYREFYQSQGNIQSALLNAQFKF